MKPIKLPRQILKALAAMPFSDDETLSNIGGILFRPLADKQVVVVATDGYRIALFTLRIQDSDHLPEKGAVLPGSLIRLAAHECKQSKNPITRNSEDYPLQFWVDDRARIYWKTSDREYALSEDPINAGNYPDFQKVMPLAGALAANEDTPALGVAAYNARFIADAARLASMFPGVSHTDEMHMIAPVDSCSPGVIVTPFKISEGNRWKQACRLAQAIMPLRSRFDGMEMYLAEIDRLARK